MSLTSLPILQASGHSVQGSGRENNEDAWFVSPSLDLFVIADGMGGHEAGEIASSRAIEVVSEFLKGRTDIRSPEDAESTIIGALHAVNRELREMVREDPDLHGMGTTCLVCIRTDDWYYIKNVGDSRAYHLGTKLTQLTTDDTLAQFLVSIGQMTVEELKRSQQKNVLLQCLGSHDFKPSSELIRLRPAIGDRLLFCTDGISDWLDDREMEYILRSSLSCKETVDTLISGAAKAGSRDDLTCIVVSIDA